MLPATAFGAVALTDMSIDYEYDPPDSGWTSAQIAIVRATVGGDEAIQLVSIAFESKQQDEPSTVQSDPPGEWTWHKSGDRWVLQGSFPEGIPPGTELMVRVTFRPGYSGAGADIAALGQNGAVPPTFVPGPTDRRHYDLETFFPKSGVNADRLFGSRANQISVDLDSARARTASTTVRVRYVGGAQTSRVTTLKSTIGAPVLGNVSVRGQAFSHLKRTVPTPVGSCTILPDTGFECPVPRLLSKTILSAHPFLAEYEISFDRQPALRAVGRQVPIGLELVCWPPSETNCANNVASKSFLFVLAADSFIGVPFVDGRFWAGALFGGEANGRSAPGGGSSAARAAAVKRRDRPRAVRVAILKRGKGQRGFSGTPNPLGNEALGERKCSWVSSRSGRFKRTPVGANGVCDVPVWVRASGASRWSFRLRKRLPAGRYVLYSRGATRAGALETSFTKRDRNRVEVVVRGRR